jgi:hypothetical protein
MNFNNQACQQNTTKVETMKEEDESADVPEPPIALSDDVKPLEETGNNSVDVPAITSEIEKNTKTDFQLQSDADLLTKMQESPLMATVFIAAPLVKNHDLKIIGQDKHLGEWEKPQGEFEIILQISTNIFIFKGTVPIPALPGSKFKFVHVRLKIVGSLTTLTLSWFPNFFKFVGSLTTKKENRSPLIEWLREKDEKDMEVMGKILQGTLLEVYGNSVFKISF